MNEAGRSTPKSGYSDDRAREIVRRAIEIDRDSATTVSESDIRQIGAEIDVRPSSIEQALHEAEGELLAHPEPPKAPVRRWALFVGVICVGVVALLTARDAMADPTIAGSYVSALVLSFLFGYITDAGRSKMRIALDGVHYGRNGDRLLKWESVVHVRTSIPGYLTLEGVSGGISVCLRDFGDPDAVLAIIRSRINRNGITDNLG